MSGSVLGDSDPENSIEKSVGWSTFPYQEVHLNPIVKEGPMRIYFLVQSGIILVLVYIQMYVQEGHYQVAFPAFGSFLVLLSLTFAIALIVAAVRRRINRNVNFRDEVVRLSIYILPVYYIVQLVGWMYEQGMIGGGG